MIKGVYTYEEAGEVLRNVEVQLRAQREGEMMALEYILVVALESGSNDSMAVFLTLGLIHLVMTPASSVLEFALMFFLQMGLGRLSAMEWARR